MDNSIKMRLDHIRQLNKVISEQVMMLEQEIADIKEKEEWISVDEAAAICGMSKATLNRYALQGIVEARKIGKFWRFAKSKVQDGSFAVTEAS
jgi:response regulator of citrate/malate metabolism